MKAAVGQTLNSKWTFKPINVHWRTTYASHSLAQSCPTGGPRPLPARGAIPPENVVHWPVF